MSISIEQVKELREVTGAGVLDCRKTLEQVDGDMKKAIEILREKGLAKAAKREERETSEGVLDLYSHGNGRIGVMVEVNCETDFVARSNVFRDLAHEIALQIAAAAPKYIHPDDISDEVLQSERETARRLGLEEGKPETIIERIVEGRLEKFKDEKCLLRQPYVRDDSITIQDLINQNIASTGEKIVIRRFVRWEVGDTE
jgi:elongation factor Ts